MKAHLTRFENSSTTGLKNEQDALLLGIGFGFNKAMEIKNEVV